MQSSHPWWRHAAVYQVYIRSFADGNADGTGDLAGLRSRLPYLADLGVDAIWVNPWYPSPLNDGGYDVADYHDINPEFGTLDEAKAFIDEAKEMGIRVLVDLVPNHTSSEHRWFKAALAAAPGSPERQMYHFKPGKGPDGAEPPTDWDSVFGGAGWTRVPDGEWYLHLFDVTQPDLNWANPKVRESFKGILRFWLDLGASGFRVDVAHSLTKDPEWPDSPQHDDELEAMAHIDNHPYWDRPELHEIVKEWRAVLDEYPGTMMVAEAWVPTWESLKRYIAPDEYHQAFAFGFLLATWSHDEFHEAIDIAVTESKSMGSIPTWVLSNHDVVRHPTRYALPQDIDPKVWILDGDRALLDEDTGFHRANAASMLMLALPGALYLYQGEELGLPEVYDLPLDVIEDPVWIRSNHAMKGRDGCRVPIPWTRGGESYGFGDDGSWLPQPEGWGELSVEAQKGVDGSTFELYRTALALRKQYLVDDEDLEWLDLGSEVLAFERGSGVKCIVNFGGDPIEVPAGELLVSSKPIVDGLLSPDAAAWIR
jgi:alpha-glucosidase